MMKYTSAFEIIGPVMVGPSSSHTAGAVRIGNIARHILRESPTDVTFQLMGSFAETYQGHGTDLALLAGILDMNTDSDDVPQAKQFAKVQGIGYRFTKGHLGFVHPNTVLIEAKGATRQVQLLASSLGGGKAEVQELNGLPLKFTGERPTLILFHQDQKGFLANICKQLDADGYNIARMALERRKRAGEAITVCEVDEMVREETIKALQQNMPMLREICQLHVK
jgi:L-serine dehydratase